MRINEQSVPELGGSSDGNRVPLIIIQITRAIVFYANGAIAQIEYVMNVPIDELHCDEVLSFSRIVHYQACKQHDSLCKTQHIC